MKMKVLYLNLYEGVRERERFERIISFINEEDPDIVVLVELEGWMDGEDRKVDLFLERTGFSFFSFNKGNVALFSKKPLLKTIGIRHGVMKVYLTENFSFIVAHLNHRDEESRLEEVKDILENTNFDESSILIGDLNSLSPLDNYEEEQLIKHFKTINLKKFGVEKLRFDVQKKIIDFGLIDTVKRFSSSFEYSVPTKFNKDPNHAAKLRLDYLYVTPNLMSKLKYSKIIRTEETEMLSDHFPIVAEFDL